jgi:hypothetical protein
MSNVHSLLNEKMNRHFDRFSYDLENAWRSAISRYNIDPTHRGVRSVFMPLNNIIGDRYDAHDTLCRHNIHAIHYGKNPQHELRELRTTLADDARRVVISFHKRITKNNVDLEDPRALAAFRAAGEILYHFLQLEHDYIRTYLEEAQTHLRLQRARRRQQTLLLSQSKHASQQDAECLP